MTCDSYVQGLVMRATLLDSCGTAVSSACGTIVSEGFVSIKVEDDVQDGEAIGPMLANGTRCYYRKTKPQLNGIKPEIEFCEVDPELYNMISGAPLVTDDADTPVALGFTTNEDTYGTANFALEVWTDLEPGGCPATSLARRWGYYLLPWITNGTIGKPKFENGSVSFMLTNAITRSPNQWGVGPYDIQYDKDGIASPLFVALDEKDHDLLYKVNMSPPSAVCGCQSLTVAT